MGNRIDRDAVYRKYKGRCAYCGKNMCFKRMQVDHLHPQSLKHFEPGLDNNRLDNLMPSCAKCNNFKGGMKLELFRSELQKQVERLRSNAQFQRALRFGQIIENECPIIFHFELLKYSDEISPGLNENQVEFLKKRKREKKR